MTKQELSLAVDEVFLRYAKLKDEIYKRAVSEGKWKMGLDSNRDLFRQANEDLKRELEDLYRRAGVEILS